VHLDVCWLEGVQWRVAGIYEQRFTPLIRIVRLRANFHPNAKLQNAIEQEQPRTRLLCDLHAG
jgi:hypothetical protein